MILGVTPVAAIGTSGVIVQGISHFCVGIAIFLVTRGQIFLTLNNLLRETEISRGRWSDVGK